MTDQHDARDAAAKKLAECMDYPWEHMPAKGREAMRQHAQAVIDAYVATQPTKPEQQAGGVPAGWRLLRDTTHDERSWHEDRGHENGNYQCCCVDCGRMFIGYKRRVVCKVCAAAPSQSAVQPLSEAQRKQITALWNKENRNYTVSDIIDAVEAAHGIVTKEGT